MRMRAEPQNLLLLHPYEYEYETVDCQTQGPRVLGFAAIKILGLEGEGLRFSTLLTNMLSLRGANHRVEEVTKLHGFRCCGPPGGDPEADLTGAYVREGVPR